MTPQPTLLPFDLAKALAGAKVVTRHGREVTGIRRCGAFIRGLVTSGSEWHWYQSGLFRKKETDALDLFLAAPLDPAPKEAGQRDPNYDGELAAANAEIARLKDELETIAAIVSPHDLDTSKKNDVLYAVELYAAEKLQTELALTTAETHAKALEGRVDQLRLLLVTSGIPVPATPSAGPEVQG
jgi:hypothetical protein